MRASPPIAISPPSANACASRRSSATMSSCAAPGVDSLKGGLCPFHDEKSPSFHVRPNHGHFHCFGCGEGGDVYAFLQKIEHVSFVEAVELLADKVGYTVTYTGSSTTNVQRDRGGSRSRLIAANAAAQEFYAEALQSAEAEPAAGI